MDEKKSEKKPPGKIAGFFAKIAAIPKKLWRLSLPTRAAIVVAVVLTGLTIFTWVVFFSDPNSVRWSQSMTFWRFAGVILLLIVIPIVTYRGLKLWLEGEGSRFPDVDYAWKAGLAALESNGVDPRSTPIFLVLGTADSAEEAALMDATSFGFRVRGIPEGPAALHWYANPEAIFVCCTEACATGALSQLEKKRAETSLAARLTDLEAASPGETTRVAPAVAAAPRSAAPPSAAAPARPEPARSAGPRDESTRGTMMLDDFVNPTGSPTDDAGATETATTATAASSQSEGDVRGTMMLDAPVQTPRQQRAQRPASPPRANLPAAHDSSETLEKLHHVCQLVRRARQPLCAINGVLSTLPFKLIQGGAAEAEQLQRAVKSDLTTIQHGLGQRFPVTSLVCGLEDDAGFRELVRRVGRERAAVQRFGRGHDVRSPATADALTALGEHVCGAFEDWTYTLFRQRDALTKPGNTSLYTLLCKVRFNLKNRLAQVLAHGYGHDPLRAGDEPLLFSGCYFASTGATEDRQAFVRGVFDKLIEEQEYVEWTDLALARDRRYLWAAYVGIAVCGAVGLWLTGMIGTQIYRAIVR